MDDPQSHPGAFREPQTAMADGSVPVAGRPARREQDLGVLGLIVMAAALAVMAATALHTAGLDPDPTWNRDWLEGAEPDPTPVSRLHDRLVATGAGLAVGVGWALAALARPRTVAVEADVAAPRPWLGGLAALDVVVVAVAFVAMDSSLIAAATILVAGALAVGLVAWQGLRGSGLDDRHAWRQAGGGAALGPVLFAVLVAALSQAPLFGVLLFPLLPISLVLGHGAWFARARPRPLAQTVPAAPAPPGSDAPRLVAPGVLLILALAVAVAWPMEEPPRVAEQDAPPSAPAPDPVPMVTAPAPATAPAAPTSAPSTVAVDLADCLPEHLTLTVGGFDSAMGKTAATLTAVNIGTEACALRGRPTVAISQGGRPIGLHLVPMSASTGELTSDELAREDPDVGVAVSPGGHARATMLWPGYRTLADQTTPQLVTVALTPGGPAIPAPIAVETGLGGNPGPAPFDLQDGVPGGVELWVGPWTPRSSPLG